MRDLFSGLIRNDLGYEQFYDKYEHLNNTTIPSELVLFRIQIQQLKQLEKTKGKKYQNTEKFIKQAKNSINGIEKDIYNLSEEKIYARIIELLNAGLWGNVDMNPTRRLKEEIIDARQRDNEINAIIAEMTSLLNKINISQPLNKKVLDVLETRLTKQSGKLNKEYTNIKSDLAEQIAVELLNKNSGFQAIASGKFQDSLGQMLIEDAFVFNKKTMNTFFGTLSFEIIQKGKKSQAQASSIFDLLNQINSLNGEYTISLSDPLYEALKKASALDAQVKSGRGAQPILTRAQRNVLDLEGFTPHSLVELYNLQKTPDQYFLPEKQQNSKDLAALANYTLSKNIAKTALASNQLYFTSKGIQTASMWMEQNNYMLKFYPEVHSMNKDFLTRKRQYQLRKINS